MRKICILLVVGGCVTPGTETNPSSADSGSSFDAGSVADSRRDAGNATDSGYPTDSDIADSADVDTRPRPDAGPLPGDCSDSTVLLDTSFEDGETFPMTGVTEASTDRAHAGSRSLLYRFTGSGKWSPGRAPEFTEAYVDYWAYNVDFPCLACPDSGGKHYFRFWHNDIRRHQIDTGGRNGSIDVEWLTWGVPNPNPPSATPPASFNAGTWHRVRVAVRLNAPGASDGRFIWMIDDEVLFDVTAEMSAGEKLTNFLFTNYDYQGDDPTGRVPRMYLDEILMRTGPGAFDCLVP